MECVPSFYWIGLVCSLSQFIGLCSVADLMSKQTWSVDKPLPFKEQTTSCWNDIKLYGLGNI